MQYEHNFYRTSDFLLDLEFLFVDRGASGWRAYILTPINYKQFSILRSDAITTIHRLTESDLDIITKIKNYKRDVDGVNFNEPIKYICWKHKVKTLDDMRNIAKMWSEITAYYIRHGGKFETIQPILRDKGII